MAKALTNLVSTNTKKSGVLQRWSAKRVQKFADREKQLLAHVKALDEQIAVARRSGDPHAEQYWQDKRDEAYTDYVTAFNRNLRVKKRHSSGWVGRLVRRTSK